jgi:calcineurin-like phosphoesterase family protein
MSNTFLISDTHFSHTNSWKTFKLANGITPMRPFTSTEEMDETMIDNWNHVVKPQDKVYHLGDIAMSKHAINSILPRLNGEKVLIKGNHDTEKISCYLQYFKDVRGSHMLDRLALSHIPIHPSCLSRWRGNIHGHLHTYQVRLDDNTVDPKYFCVSVEQIKYTPIPFEEVNDIFKSRGL